MVYGMNSMTSSTNISQFVNCSITAWISPAHAFLDFNCGPKMQSTVGFYPFKNTYFGLERRNNPAILRIEEVMAKEEDPLTSKDFSVKSLFYVPLMPKATTIAGSSYSLNIENKAILIDDTKTLQDCMQRRIPCLFSHLNVTSTVAKKAWTELLFIQNAIKLFNEEAQCPVDKTLSAKYKFKDFGNNCIDFMRRIMDSTGMTQWKHQMKYTFKPCLRDKIFAIAWHYFNWT